MRSFICKMEAARRLESKIEPIDTEHTSEVVCPHCGKAQSDSWEFKDSEDVECGSCEKPFHVERHTSVTYTTTKTSPAGL